ncbi:MAG: PIN domain-containing protein [Anaerolineae bacterium]|nr:PIN domain-containing protein [Anaerolineae bacterium]
MAALVSSGGLYALADRSDEGHAAAVAALSQAGGLVALAPVITEAVQLAERLLDEAAGDRLLGAVVGGELLFQPLEPRDWTAAQALRRAEEGLSLTDALVLAVAARLGVETVLCREPALARAARRQGRRPLPEE